MAANCRGHRSTSSFIPYRRDDSSPKQSNSGNEGIQAILTRQTDVDLGLQSRVDIANRARATLFVSIHANAISMSRPEVNGIETFHVAGSVEGQRLAASFQQQLLASTGMRDLLGSSACAIAV